MPRIASAQQHFGAVISDQAASKKDLAASAELEKCLRVMGLYENDEGSRRRKVGAGYVRVAAAAPLARRRERGRGRRVGGRKAERLRVGRRRPGFLTSTPVCGRMNVCKFVLLFFFAFSFSLRPGRL